MKGFDVLNVKSAVRAHNKLDLSRTHLTTMDFGQIVPLLAEETVPGDKFNISGEYFSRLAPLVKPTYGKFSFKTVTAFVPYHQIAVDSDAWFAGKTTWEGQTPHQRFFTYMDLVSFVIANCVTTSGATASNSVFDYTDASGTLQHTVFTSDGKFYVKVLTALGYSLPQGVNLKTTSSWYTDMRNTQLSAYPFLAFFKLYNDYMFPSTRFNSAPLTDFLYCVKYGKVNASFWTEATGEINSSGIALCMSQLHLTYDSDYFVSAWQNPNNPIAGIESISGFDTPGVPTITPIAQSVSADYATFSVQSSKVYVTQRALDFLKRFDDWVRRNNYSGSRSVQQIYSRFGIKTDDYKSHYAHVYSTDVIPVQVGDVTATADSSNVPLGDYAGKGIMNGGKNVSIEVSDYGLILVLGYFTVVPMNAFGFDRKVLRTSPLDYYNPEFDGVGAEAISVGEFWTSPIADVSDTSKDTDVYGFTERYNSYRYGRDMITGEFRDYHANGDMNVWHTGRNLSALRAAGTLVAQSLPVTTMVSSGSEYNRIFSVTSGNVDHFYLTANFHISAVRPMMNLNQVVDLGEGDTSVPRNGNVIS